MASKLRTGALGTCYARSKPFRGCARKEARAKLPSLTLRAAAALQLFEAGFTQMRHGFDGPTGFDYAGVRIAAEEEGIRLTWVWELFRALEREFLAVLGKKREKARKDEDRKAAAAKGPEMKKRARG